MTSTNSLSDRLWCGDFITEPGDFHENAWTPFAGSYGGSCFACCPAKLALLAVFRPQPLHVALVAARMHLDFKLVVPASRCDADTYV